MSDDKKIQLSKELEVLKNALSIQQLKFTEGIANGMKEYEAYEYAGLSTGSPEDRAEARRLARMPKIRLYKDALLREVATRSVMTLEAVDQELTNIASTDITELIEQGELFQSYNEAGLPDGAPVQIVQLKPLEELTDAQKASIKKIKPCTGGVEIVLHDKLKALELLAKRHQGFTEKMDVNVDGNVQVVAFVGDNGRGPKD